MTWAPGWQSGCQAVIQALRILSVATKLPQRDFIAGRTSGVDLILSGNQVASKEGR